MPPLSSRTSDVLNVEPYYTKEYISRCRVRALRHFPVEKRMQPSTFGFDAEFIVPEWKECISDKSNLSHRLPYRKPHKMIRNSRKSRRKQHCENDASDAFHQIMDLDRLASTITHTVTDNVDVRIKDLLDRIQFEIFKHKSKSPDFEYNIFASIRWSQAVPINHLSHLNFNIGFYFRRIIKSIDSIRCKSVIVGRNRLRLCSVLSDSVETSGDALRSHVLHGKHREMTQLTTNQGSIYNN